MQWLIDFLASLREPVFGFLGVAWPVLALGAVGLVWYFLFDMQRSSRANGGGDAGDGVVDGTDGDGGGGDGGD